MQDFAAKLFPYVSQIAFALMILFGLTILVGSLILIRRALVRKNEAASQEDYDRIAHELDGEIRRLADLRNRLDPRFQDTLPRDGLPREMNLNDESGPSLAVSNSENLALEAEVTEARERIKVLELEITASRALAENKSAAPAGDGGEAAAADLSVIEDKHNAEVLAIKDRHSAEVKDLNTKVAALETMLSDYKIFEEDLSQVKRFRQENEQLVTKLKESGIEWTSELVSASSPAPSPESTSSFTKKVPDKVVAATAPAAPEIPSASAADELLKELMGETPSESTEPSVDSEISKSEIDSLFDDLMTPQSASAEASPEPTTAPSAPSAPVEEPAAAQTDSKFAGENAEDLAESAANDDNLMAEFEKLLGGKP